MSNLSIKASTRQPKKSIAEGQLPAVVYGRDMESTAIAVDSLEFKKLFEEAGESIIFNLSVDGKDHDVLVHDFQ